MKLQSIVAGTVAVAPPDISLGDVPTSPWRLILLQQVALATVLAFALSALWLPEDGG